MRSSWPSSTGNGERCSTRVGRPATAKGNAHATRRTSSAALKSSGSCAESPATAQARANDAALIHPTSAPTSSTTPHASSKRIAKHALPWRTHRTVRTIKAASRGTSREKPALTVAGAARQHPQATPKQRHCRPAQALSKEARLSSSAGPYALLSESIPSK